MANKASEIVPIFDGDMEKALRFGRQLRAAYYHAWWKKVREFIREMVRGPRMIPANYTPASNDA